MKKILLLLPFLLLPGVVSAHQLETDGTIGAVLHVDPSDDPIATKPSAFYFEFQDRDGKFQIANCLCTVVVSENGKQLDSEQLAASSLTTSSFTYAFPEKGVYEVQVIGVPQPADAFQPFSLKYSIRVARTPDDKAMIPIWVWVVVAGVGVGGLTVAGMMSSRATVQKHRTKAKSNESEGGDTGH